MLPALPLSTSTWLFVVASLLSALLVHRGMPAGIARRAAVRVALPLWTLGGLGHVAWGVGPLLAHYPTSYWGATTGSVTLVLLTALTIGLAISAVLSRVLERTLPGWSEASSETAEPLPSQASVATVLPNDRGLLGRRAVLKAAAVTPPLFTLGAGTAGFCTAFTPSKIATRVLTFESLPKPLDGLRILQLSDAHLGFGRQLDDVERMLRALEGASERPDLIVLTGDIAERVSLLPDALRLVAGLKPRCGVLAALGNHEHLQGVRAARRAFDGSDVRLLVDEGVHVGVDGAELFIAGIDDPVIVHTDIRPRLVAPLERALGSSNAGAFRVLLSHRPEAFDLSAERGVELTLSGHTHGGQIGFAGKSAFEPLYRDGYLWGRYQRGRSRLYTTSGFGAWFPFRLGCPSEAPLIVLRSA